MTFEIGHLLALCSQSAAAIGSLPGETLLVGALFSMGLGGSFAHCAMMCGPLVLAQTARASAPSAHASCPRALPGGGWLLAYHAGRLTTYGLLGAGSAFVGGAISSLPLFRNLSGALLILAGVVVIAQGLRLLRAPKAARKPSPLVGLIRAAARRVSHPSAGAQFGLGAVMGFLPCALLYGAIAAAASASSVGYGGLGLVAFGLGTTPTLMVISRFGHWAFANAGVSLGRLRGAFIGVNSLLLFGLAWQRFAGV